jgi:hypothetical protein
MLQSFITELIADSDFSGSVLSADRTFTGHKVNREQRGGCGVRRGKG